MAIRTHLRCCSRNYPYLLQSKDEIIVHVEIVSLFAFLISKGMISWSELAYIWVCLVTWCYTPACMWRVSVGGNSMHLWNFPSTLSDVIAKATAESFRSDKARTPL